MAYAYRVCMVHVYSMLFVQGNANLATECQLDIDYISGNSGHKENSQPCIVGCMSASLNSRHGAHY